MKVRIILAALAITLTAGACAVPVENEVSAGHSKPGKTTAKAAKKTPPVALKAVETEHDPGVFAEGTYTAVKVTITNRRKSGLLDVAPFYFAVVDSKGGKHEASDSTGVDKNEFDLTKLAPGEHATGTVAMKGRFVPTKVTFTLNGFGTVYSAPVAQAR